MKTKTIKYRLSNVTYELYVEMTTYQGNDSLALLSYIKDENNNFKSFGTITKCIWNTYPGIFKAYIDVIDFPGIDKALERAGIAKPTGNVASDGFCNYPEYVFSADF